MALKCFSSTKISSKVFFIAIFSWHFYESEFFPKTIYFYAWGLCKANGNSTIFPCSHLPELAHPAKEIPI
jgi:hypothetical protein